jgi:hypothetical protein
MAAENMSTEEAWSLLVKENEKVDFVIDELKLTDQYDRAPGDKKAELEAIIRTQLRKTYIKYEEANKIRQEKGL